MYNNSLARHFSPMFHAKCLLPRLDTLLPVRSWPKKFVSVKQLSKCRNSINSPLCNIRWKLRLILKANSKSKQPPKALSSLSRPPTTDGRPLEAGRRTVSHFCPPQLVSYVTQNDLVYYPVKDIKANWTVLRKSYAISD